MSTKGILDRCLPDCPGWSRDTGVRNLLAIAQKAVDDLFDMDHEAMIYRGTDNKGFPPYLLTTAGTYRYDVAAANLSCGAITRTISGSTYTFVVRKIRSVFVDISSGRASIEQQWVGEPYHLSVNPFSSVNNRIWVQEVKGNSQPAYENTPAYFEFLEDPTTTTDRYFIEFYVGPPRLLSQNIPLPIPVVFETAIEDYIIGYVQRRTSGRTNDNEQKFLEYWKPRFETFWNGCTNMAENNTQPRIC